MVKIKIKCGHKCMVSNILCILHQLHIKAKLRFSAVYNAGNEKYYKTKFSDFSYTNSFISNATFCKNLKKTNQFWPSLYILIN